MDTDRRQALASAGAVFAMLASAGRAQGCPAEGVTAGSEIAPGVREIFLTSREVRLANCKLLWMTHLILAPGAATSPDIVANDTVVLLEQGLLRVSLDEQEFVLCGTGALWAFPEGSNLAYRNTGTDPAVLRVIELLPGLSP